MFADVYLHNIYCRIDFWQFYLGHLWSKIKRRGFSDVFVQRTCSWCTAACNSFYFEFKIVPHAEPFLRAICGKQRHTQHHGKNGCLKKDSRREAIHIPHLNISSQLETFWFWESLSFPRVNISTFLTLFEAWPRFTSDLSQRSDLWRSSSYFVE